MPCEKLAHLDKRYRERYGMSMVENLKMFREKDLEEFLESQVKKYGCPNCGIGVVCVHDGKCFNCGYKRKV
jgi:ribosomal protein S27AE